MVPAPPDRARGTPPAPEGAPGGAEAPSNLPRRRVFVHLDGLVAVHAARAVHTALAGVPGVCTAEVTLAGADLTVEGPLDRGALAAAVALAGAQVREVTEWPRTLPVLEAHDGA
jgi:hypothetical protein